MEQSEMMFGVPKEEPEMIELMNHRAMIELPENSVEVEIKCRVFYEGQLLSVSKTMTMEELRTAFKKADEGYIDDDDVFTITNKGRAYLEETKNKH